MSLSHYLETPLLNAERKGYGDGSKVILSKKLKPVGVIVFIHGFRLSPDPFDTWNDFPDLLPEIEKAADYDLVFYSYDCKDQAIGSATRFARFLEALAERPAPNVVNPSLAVGLESRPADFRYSRIIICAHSLGAIVSRLALVELIRERTGDGKALPEWFGNVRLVFFGPAHMGAKIVPLLCGAIATLANLSPVAKLVPVAPLLKLAYQSLVDVEENSRTLNRLSAETQKILDKHTGRAAFLRARVLHGERDVVVDKTPFLSDHMSDEVDDVGHLKICKPKGEFLQPLHFLVEEL